MNFFDYSRPSTTENAVQLMRQNPGAAFIAGGTNLVDLMKRGVVSVPKIIDITALPLDTIEERGNTVFIGALVKNSTAATHPLILSQFPLIAMAIRAGASAQIRNMATMAGNILQRTRCTYFYDVSMPCNKRAPGSGCSALQGYNRMHAIFGASEHCIAVHPGDLGVALAVYETTVMVTGSNGERRMPIHEFHRLPGNRPDQDNLMKPGELITGFEIRKSGFGSHVDYLKIRDRASYAFALVSVATGLQLDRNRIVQAKLAMGGVAHKPWPLREAEIFLKNKEISDAVFREAATVSLNQARGYGYNNFKIKMAAAAIAESLARAAKATDNGKT